MKFLLTLLGSISMLSVCIHESVAMEIVTKIIEPQYFGMQIHRENVGLLWRPLDETKENILPSRQITTSFEPVIIIKSV
jgi:hypothetical protein